MLQDVSAQTCGDLMMLCKPKVQSFLDLSDHDFMLAMCVREENLMNPARWCSEMRLHARAVERGPSTSEEADWLLMMGMRLADEATGAASQSN